MIGGPLALARREVDGAAGAALGERARKQCEIDAQAPVALERAQPIVPPGVEPLGLWKQAERIREAGVEHRAQRAALGLGDMDLARPALGIVYVAVLRRDVHVAEDRELRGSRQELLHPARQRLIPVQLVRVLLRAGRLAVRRIEAHDANAAYGSRDAALRVVGEVGDAVRDISD